MFFLHTGSYFLRSSSDPQKISTLLSVKSADNFHLREHSWPHLFYIIIDICLLQKIIKNSLRWVTLKSHLSIGVFVVYIDTGSPVPNIPSKSRGLANEYNKFLTEWQWFESSLFPAMTSILVLLKKNLCDEAFNDHSCACRRRWTRTLIATSKWEKMAISTTSNKLLLTIKWKTKNIILSEQFQNPIKQNRYP